MTVTSLASQCPWRWTGDGTTAQRNPFHFRRHFRINHAYTTFVGRLAHTSTWKWRWLRSVSLTYFT